MSSRCPYKFCVVCQWGLVCSHLNGSGPTSHLFTKRAQKSFQKIIVRFHFCRSAKKFLRRWCVRVCLKRVFPHYLTLNTDSSQNVHVLPIWHASWNTAGPHWQRDHKPTRYTRIIRPLLPVSTTGSFYSSFAILLTSLVVHIAGLSPTCVSAPNESLSTGDTLSGRQYCLASRKAAFSAHCCSPATSLTFQKLSRQAVWFGIR